MKKYKELINNILFISSESIAIILTCNLFHKFQFEYYTLDSNLFAFIIGCIYVLYLNKEKKILENIFSYLKDKTVIVISHRFNNKKCFDRVLKLENGKIYES